jgi:hypothetical protein
LQRNYFFELIELKFADVSVTFQLLKFAALLLSYIIDYNHTERNKS